VLPAKFGADVMVGGAYDILWNELGTPVTLFIYVIGVSAVCFHLAHGLCRAATRAGLVSSKKGVNGLRYAAGAIGFVLWAASLQLISRFAVGQGLFG
jgi:hypothetical protein